MAYNKPKRPLQPITIANVGDVAVRGLLMTEREDIVRKYGGDGQRMMFTLQVLHRTVVDPDTSEPIMTIEEWDEAAAADDAEALRVFSVALRLSGMSRDDAPGGEGPKD